MKTLNIQVMQYLAAGMRTLGYYVGMVRQSYASLSAYQRFLGAALCILCLSLLVESFIFNVRYFSFDSTQYQEQVVTLQGQGGTGGIPLDAAHNIVKLSPNVPVKTVFVKLSAPQNRMQHVSLSFSDSLSTNQLVTASIFALTTAEPYNTYLATINAYDKVSNLQLVFEPRDLVGGVLLTEFVLNKAPTFNFSLLRVSLLFLSMLGLYALFAFKLYRLRLDFEHSLPQRMANYAVLGVGLALSVGYFLLVSPLFTQPLSFNYIGEISLSLSDPEHRLLVSVPDTIEELNHSDQYAVLFSALKQGQVTLGLPVDPRLLDLSDPYDPGLRQMHGVKFYWDYSFYAGHYYTYYGLTPLLLCYLPVFLLTGKLPVLALSGLILSLLAAGSLFFAVQSLRKAFFPKANLVLYLFSELALILCSGVFILQTQVEHYVLPYISGIICFGLAAGCAYKLLTGISVRTQRLCFLGIGIAIVLMVWSRPLDLVLLLLFCAYPLCKYLLTAKGRISVGWELLTSKQSMLFLMLPVGMGALITCIYNYVRFDSIFEFGVRYTLTNNNLNLVLDSGEYTLDKFFMTMWHYYLEPLHYVKNFPFVLAASGHTADYGSFIQMGARFPILGFPMMYALFLLFFKGCLGSCCRKQEENTKSVEVLPKNCQLLRINPQWMQVNFLVTLLTCILFSYLVFSHFGAGFRFSFEYTVPLGLMSLTLLCRSLGYESTPYSICLFSIVLILLVKSSFVGLMLPFSDVLNFMQQLNPQALIYFVRTFEPLAY